MKIAPVARAACAIALLALAGCGKNSSPTEPFYPANTDYGVTAILRSSNGAATLQGWQVFLDGAPISNVVTYDRPVAQASVGGSMISLASGTHRFGVRVLRQSTSPTAYVLEAGKLSFVSPTMSWTQTIGGASGVLNEGDSLETTFRF